MEGRESPKGPVMPRGLKGVVAAPLPPLSPKMTAVVLKRGWPLFLARNDNDWR